MDVNVEQSRNENTAQEKSDKSRISETVVVDIAEVLGMPIKEEKTSSLVFGRKDTDKEIVYESEDTEENLKKKFKDLDKITSVELGDANVVRINTPTPTPTPMPTATPTPTPIIECTVPAVDQSNALLQISNPDPNYNGAVINLSADDRYILEMLVMGEAEGEGLEGAALVAQTVRDTIVYKGYTSVSAIRSDFGYSKNMTKAPNQNVKNAVAYIFDQGGCAVKHRIYYFYAPAKVSSNFHESQESVVNYGGHKFFDEW